MTRQDKTLRIYVFTSRIYFLLLDSPHFQLGYPFRPTFKFFFSWKGKANQLWKFQHFYWRKTRWPNISTKRYSWSKNSPTQLAKNISNHYHYSLLLYVTEKLRTIKNLADGFLRRKRINKFLELYFCVNLCFFSQLLPHTQ